MSKKLLSLLLILPALTFCAPKASENGSLKDIPEIHDADTVLATNVNVEKFLTEVSYPDTDYSFTKIFDYYGGYNESCTEEPDSDLPPVYCIRWNAEPGAGKLVFELKEPGAERTEILKRGSNCVSFTNLLPNTGYTFKVSSQKSGKVLTEGSFCTTGHLHQVWFKDNCRNARDLGGWTTTDGKTVKYRKIYRGGRMEKWTLSKLGGKEVLQEGIKAQLDLRGHSDVLSAPAVQGLKFCAPVIEQGGPTMLIDDAAKTKQCFDFILNCVKEDKPVYYHCSLGRDRTGTLTILLLGVLGVAEGDISKEFELTYFAPRGWSIAYSEDNLIFANDRTKWACEPTASYLRSLAGDEGSIGQGAQNYLLSIGVSQEDIDCFRTLMLTQ